MEFDVTQAKKWWIVVSGAQLLLWKPSLHSDMFGQKAVVEEIYFSLRPLQEQENNPFTQLEN